MLWENITHCVAQLLNNENNVQNLNLQSHGAGVTMFHCDDCYTHPVSYTKCHTCNGSHIFGLYTAWLQVSVQLLSAQFISFHCPYLVWSLPCFSAK